MTPVPPPGDLEQARWAALVDREAVGEPLDDHDRRWLARYEADHPELAGERAVFEGAVARLHELLAADEREAALGDDAPLPADALAALARHRDVAATQVGEQLGEQLGEQVGERPARGLRSPAGWLAVGLGLAAAAGLTVWVALARDDAPEQARAGDRDLSAAPNRRAAPPRQPRPAVPEPIPERRGASVDAAARLTMVAPAATLGDGFAPGQGSADLLAEQVGRACLSWVDPVAVVCFEGELRSITDPAQARAGQRRLRLEQGRLVAALAPLGPGQTFVVETASGTATAVGTVFAVELHEGRTWLTVLEGLVELRDPSMREVAAGQRTALRGEVPGDEPTPLAALVPTALAELVGVAELLRASPGRADLDVPLAAELGAASLRLDGQPIPSPVRLSLAPGSHRLELLDGDGELVRTHTLDLRDDGPALDLTAELAPPAARRPAAKTPRATAKQLAEAAQEARRERDYDRTAALYRELLDRYPDSPEAANVPVRLGDLLLARDPAGALAAYELYLERDAKQLRPEAEYGRIKALRALGRAAEAKAASAAFIEARPDDYRSAELAI